jgi:23S rRNA (guanosine2251-2'-O)-methyltransferase
MNPDVVYGIHAIVEAIEAGRQINKLFLQDGTKGELIDDLRTLARKQHVYTQNVPREKLNRLTTKNHQGAVALVSPVVYHRFADILPQVFESGEVPLILLLDRITDVGNLGAIARSAVCAGVHCLVLPMAESALVTSDSLKSSSGALNIVPVCREYNLAWVIDFAQKSGLQVVACTEKAPITMYKTDFTVPTMLVVGSEEDGIAPELLQICNSRVQVPMTNLIASLNVSVAAGVVLFEAVRQRQ